MNVAASRLSARTSQCGATAIEFALVMPIFILILYGLITFGSAFYTQMAVSRAAEDGARSITYLTTAKSYSSVTDAVKTLIRTEVINSLSGSAIAPAAYNATFASRQAWMESNLRTQIIVDNGACSGTSTATDSLRIKFSFPYAATRILPPIELPGLGDSSWMPSTLTGCAIVKL